MDEFGVIFMAKNIDGIISDCDVKGYGVQPIAIRYKLIKEETCSFFSYDKKI